MCSTDHWDMCACVCDRFYEQLLEFTVFVVKRGWHEQNMLGLLPSKYNKIFVVTITEDNGKFIKILSKTTKKKKEINRKKAKQIGTL